MHEYIYEHLTAEIAVRAKAFLVAALTLLSSHAFAVDEASLPKSKHTRLGLYLTPVEASEMIAPNPEQVLFIDVRTPAEIAFVGMPTPADANVPYMVMPDFPVWDEEKATLKLELNPDFVPEVRRRLEKKGLGPDARVVVMCRSGDRSAASANLLAEAGFTNVWSIVEGFEGDMAREGAAAGTRSVNGWKNAGLPWSYKLVREKMYGLQ